MSKCKILKDLIQARTALAAPGVYDALSALLAEQGSYIDHLAEKPLGVRLQPAVAHSLTLLARRNTVSRRNQHA
jgi:hypothetical protein